MKINAYTRIDSGPIVLVPYRDKHVPHYHTWMSSPEIMYLTGSEPLTGEQEYAMQQAWLEDETKCTFIVLDLQKFLRIGHEARTKCLIETTVVHPIAAMIGDTNLYFNDKDEPRTAECQIMIAEQEARGRGFGKRAMMTMFRYGIEVLKVNKYRAKIKLDNSRSIGMFTKLGFNEVSKSEVFKETTMEKQVDDEWIERLMQETPDYRIDNNFIGKPIPSNPYDYVDFSPYSSKDFENLEEDWERRPNYYDSD